MGTEKKAGDLEEIHVLEGISESEEIDRRVEELMAPEEEGNGKKKKKKQKQNQLQKRSQNAQKQGKILRQLQQNSEQRCKKPHLMQRVHLRMQL